MKKLISGLALAAVLGSMAPLAAAAADSNQLIAPGTSFEIVDKATGDVLGQLVSVGSNAQVIAAMADRARAQKPTQIDLGTKPSGKSTQEWQQFWNQQLPSVGGG